MNRRLADRLVGLVVAVVLLGGGVLTWQAYQRRRATDGMMGSMMDSQMGNVHGPDPLVYVFVTVLLAVVVVGFYAVVRDSLPAETGATTGSPTGTDANEVVDQGRTTPSEESTVADQSEESTVADQSEESTVAGRTPSPPESNPRERVLDLLPDDERRVLEPVIDSPGITQIELRDRADFSKSKVSQTVSELEKRGLLYRESQGRTYRIYPSDELERTES